MSVVDLTRDVLIAAPYDSKVISTVKVESLPVWFDLGWQKVDGEDYTPFGEVQPAAPETSQAVDDLNVAVPPQ